MIYPEYIVCSSELPIISHETGPYKYYLGCSSILILFKFNIMFMYVLLLVNGTPSTNIIDLTSLFFVCNWEADIQLHF